MKLRTRLIVAFLLLSVVPLGAVTIYSYRSNVSALQSDGAHQADLLAGELAQRMQLVTAQLSERVQHLMDLPQAPAPPPAPRPAQPKAAPASAESNAAAASTAAAIAEAAANAEATRIGGQVADALGEAAILLNTVELPDMRTSGFTGNQSRQNRPASGGSGSNRQATPAGPGAAGPSKRPVMVDDIGAPMTFNMPSMPNVPNIAGNSLMPPGRDTPRFQPAPGRASGGRSGSSGASMGPATPVPPAGPGVAAPGAPPAQTIVTMSGGGGGTSDSDRIKIDLQPIRRDLYRQILPGGRGETLTAEERQRVAREVNQRMLGIVEGIKLSAAELQKKAEAARAKAAETEARTAATPTTPVTTTTPTTSPAPPASPTATTPKPPAESSAKPPSAETAAAPSPLTRRSALSGDRLDVTIEQNGQVVRSANAEINLPNVLMTVFSTTRHEQGEVPFAIGKDGHIYAPTDEDRARIEALGAVARPDGPLGPTVLPEWIVVTTQDPTGSGLRFGIARPVGESLTALRRTAGRNAGFGLLFIGAAIVGIVPLSSRLTRNLTSLTGGVTRIAQGDYGARVSVAAHDEFGELAGAFNRMAAQVEEHQRAIAGQERIKRELELGRQIQHDMLPHTPLKFGLTEIQGVSVPAREVGGDFFNYFALPSGHVALLVGDVSGKGVGAALLMANIQASLRTRFALGQDLSAIANAIDLDIDANSPGPMYATLFLGILDPSTRELRYVNAGHNPQFVLRKQGGLEKMSSTGLPVGLLAGRGYEEITMPLAPGDLVFFYTDGCVETENEVGEMFGADRLEPLLVSVHAAGADNVLQHVERALEQFRGARELYDDATMMAVRIG